MDTDTSIKAVESLPETAPMQKQAPNRQKERRNVSLDPELNEYLSNEVDNASGLINDLLLAYRAYDDATDAVAYVEEKHKQKFPVH